MTTANLIDKRDEQATQNSARAAIDSYTAKSDEGTTLGPIPVFHARHLDVDAVLARSLAKVVSE